MAPLLRGLAARDNWLRDDTGGGANRSRPLPRGGDRYRAQKSAARLTVIRFRVTAIWKQSPGAAPRPREHTYRCSQHEISLVAEGLRRQSALTERISRGPMFEKTDPRLCTRSCQDLVKSAVCFDRYKVAISANVGATDVIAMVDSAGHALLSRHAAHSVT